MYTWFWKKRKISLEHSLDLNKLKQTTTKGEKLFVLRLIVLISSLCILGCRQNTCKLRLTIQSRKRCVSNKDVEINSLVCRHLFCFRSARVDSYTLKEYFHTCNSRIHVHPPTHPITCSHTGIHTHTHTHTHTHLTLNLTVTKVSVLKTQNTELCNKDVVKPSYLLLAWGMFAELSASRHFTKRKSFIGRVLYSHVMLFHELDKLRVLFYIIVYVVHSQI